MKKKTGDRLKEIMAESNLKQVDIIKLAQSFIDKEQLDIKISKTDLSQYVNNITEPRQDKLFILANALNVSEAWLMGYDVKKNRDKTNSLQDHTKEIINVVNKLNYTRQEKVLNFADYQLSQQENVNISNDKILNMFDYQDLEVQSKVSAGTGIVDLEPDYTETVRFNGYVPSDFDMIFEVSGDSMEPMFKDGELIFIEFDQEVRNGQIGVVQINGESFLKKMYIENNELKLISLNKDYDNIIATEADDVKVVGRVLI